MTETFPNKLIDELRAGCNGQHEALHTHPLLAPLGRADITLNDYQWILRGFYHAYRVMEQKRGGFVDARLPDAPVMAWLEQDIKHHNIVMALETPNDYKPLQEPADLIGYLYVKQGSSLGGQIISKHLEKYLGLVPGRDNQFFAGYGQETGIRWKEFVSQLAALPAGYSQARIVKQAQDSFDFVATCLDQVYQQREHAEAA